MHSRKLAFASIHRKIRIRFQTGNSKILWDKLGDTCYKMRSSPKEKEKTQETENVATSYDTQAREPVDLNVAAETFLCGIKTEYTGFRRPLVQRSSACLRIRRAMHMHQGRHGIALREAHNTVVYRFGCLFS